MRVLGISKKANKKNTAKKKKGLVAIISYVRLTQVFDSKYVAHSTLKLSALPPHLSSFSTTLPGIHPMRYPPATSPPQRSGAHVTRRHEETRVWESTVDAAAEPQQAGGWSMVHLHRSTNE